MLEFLLSGQASHLSGVVFFAVGFVSVFPDFLLLWMLWQCLSGYYLPEEILVKSGKFQKLDEMLPKLKREGHRVLIFSQFVIMLDVLQEYLHIRGHRYLRLDGSTPVTLRCVRKSSHLWLNICNININILTPGHLITYLSAQRWWWSSKLIMDSNWNIHAENEFSKNEHESTPVKSPPPPVLLTSPTILVLNFSI